MPKETYSAQVDGLSGGINDACAGRSENTGSHGGVETLAGDYRNSIVQRNDEEQS